MKYRKEGMLCRFLRPQVDRELGHFLRFLKQAKHLNEAWDYQHLTIEREQTVELSAQIRETQQDKYSAEEPAFQGHQQSTYCNGEFARYIYTPSLRKVDRICMRKCISTRNLWQEIHVGYRCTGIREKHCSLGILWADKEHTQRRKFLESLCLGILGVLFLLRGIFLIICLTHLSIVDPLNTRTAPLPQRLSVCCF